MGSRKAVSRSEIMLFSLDPSLLLRSCRTLLRLYLCPTLIAVLCACPVNAKPKQPENYGGGLSVSVPANEAELAQAVQDVVADGIIQGSKEYNKDEYISGAEAASESRVFRKWAGPGQVFYKIKKNALDPRNFKDSGDSGVLAVRYIVQTGDAKSTFLKIEAIFVDDNHHGQHLSNGSVEAAEYKDIQDHLAAMQLKKTEATQAEQRHQQQLAAQDFEQKRKQQRIQKVVARDPDETLQQHVDRLRHEVERQVKSPGSQLKSAPFKSASSLLSLSSGTHVVILISTRYWYGVETESGQHGWIHRSELEQLP
jgi:Skp family chaperone for outer membrane proteins